MTATITRTFPAYSEQMHQWVGEHLERKDEPLILALYYAPERRPEDIFLLEVIEDFAGNRLDAERELFEVAFTHLAGFPIEPDQRVRLVLTSPTELRIALKEHWLIADEIREAVCRGRSEVIYSVPEIGEALLREIRG